LGPIDPYWSYNILQPLLTDILENHANLIAYLPKGVFGNANAARLSNTLQSGSNVHAVAKNITFLDDNVANMNANAEFDSLLWQYLLITVAHAVLYFRGATRGIYSTGKCNQDSIPCPLNNATAMLRNLRF
jgi:hypothetical protein